MLRGLVAMLGMCAGALAAQAPEFERAMTLGQFERAREIINDAVARPDVGFDTLMKIGLAAAGREWYSDAARVFERCVKERPASFEAHYNLALADFGLQQYPAALRALESAPAGSGAQAPAREYLSGKIYDALGKPEAERHLAAAFRQAPEQENYALDLGVFYLRSRYYTKAIVVLEQAASRHPQSNFVALELSLAHSFGGDRDRAVEICTRLLRADPAFAPARLLLAYTFYMGGEYERCEKAAAEAGLGAADRYPYLYYVHAAALLRLNSNDRERMLRELGLAARSIPRCTLCYFTRSKVHEQLGNEAAAMADLEKVVREIDPGFAEAWYRLALLYQRAGRREDAAAARARFRAIKSDPDRESELVRSQFFSAPAR